MLSPPPSEFARIPFTQRCRVRHGGQWSTGVVCNLSVQGVYVTLDVLPEADATVDVSFLLPRGEAPLEAVAVVTWQNLAPPETVDSLPPGCGLRFVGLSLENEARIEALVSEHKKRLPTGVSAGLRVPYLQRCQVTTGAEVRPGVVCNLSASGVYVTLEILPEIGAHLVVSFLLPGDPHSFQCGATVTWRSSGEPRSLDGLPPGCGLRFDELPAPEYKRIERVLLDYCGDLTPRDD